MNNAICNQTVVDRVKLFLMQEMESTDVAHDLQGAYYILAQLAAKSLDEGNLGGFDAPSDNTLSGIMYSLRRLEELFTTHP